MEIVFETIDFKSLDGFQCNLKHLKSNVKANKGPVMLVHGAGVRANIFNPPTPKNIITALAEEGYDVWLENWRGSIEFAPNQWDLDQAGLYDHPVAVKKVVELTGAKKIKTIIHCQGSTSFMISAALGLVPEVELIISNAVSLHPVIPGFSKFKITKLLPLIKRYFSYLNPQWGLNAPDFKTRLLRSFVLASHREKDTTVGKFVSFTYGSGFPALWRLENLDEDTKEWIKSEFASVPISFFEHMKKCVRQHAISPVKGDSQLPETYISQAPKTDARIILFTGEKNQCFLPESQEATFRYLNGIKPGYHRLHTIKGYSHLDIFLGRNAHKDVFPLMIKELNLSNHEHTQKNKTL